MNTPNKLTVARMIMVPFLVVFLLTGWGGEANRYISLILFVAASITDWFDGYLARKNHLVTNFGKFMDPLADKLLVCSAMICMIELGRLPAWFVIIIIGREFIISGFRLIAAENGIVIAANYWGKFKTVSQMIMIILLILHFDLSVFVILEQIFIWLSLALTVISLMTYIWQNRSVLAPCRITAAKQRRIKCNRADFCGNRNTSWKHCKYQQCISFRKMCTAWAVCLLSDSSGRQ